MDRRRPSVSALPEDLVIEVRRLPRHVVLRLTGDLDLHSAGQLHEALADLSSGAGGHVVVDLRDVTFLDSVALGVLVSALKGAHGHDGRLDLVCGEERLLRLFRITGLDSAFSIHADLAAALG